MSSIGNGPAEAAYVARSIGERLLSRAARISLKPDEASRLIACASTLIHGVVPQPQKILDAVSVLRRCGDSADLEGALAALLKEHCACRQPPPSP